MEQQNEITLNKKQLRIKIYRELKKEHIKEVDKIYRENHKEHIKEQKKKYREENKEHIKEEKKKYREENKEHIKKVEKKYREEHKEHIQEYSKNYREAHKHDTITCLCGVQLLKKNKARHVKSDGHLKFLEISNELIKIN